MWELEFGAFSGVGVSFCRVCLVSWLQRWLAWERVFSWYVLDVMAGALADMGASYRRLGDWGG